MDASADDATEFAKMAMYSSKRKNSLAVHIDAVRRQSMLAEQYRKDQRAGIAPDKDDKVIYLPRGGIYVATNAGGVQFGIPPESIKDCMKLGLELPQFYVVPQNQFDLDMGLSATEFEFPAYYNFFFKRRAVRLVCHKDDKPWICDVFQECILGPAQVQRPTSFSERVPEECYPDLMKEMACFNHNPFEPGTQLSVDLLLNFVFYDDVGVADLGNGVTINAMHDEYHVMEDGELSVQVSAFVIVTPPEFTDGLVKHEVGDVDAFGTPRGRLVEENKLVYYLTGSGHVELHHFVPPYFGVTMLGNSDGFDKDGITTGFILWMNRRGFMVDPPPHCSTHLKRHGIHPRLIIGIILTHCHADHDAGTFQRIVEDSMLTVITTHVVMSSFLYKYSAISGLDSDFLCKLFMFREVQVGRQTPVYGGTLQVHL
jgi:hypothetical protein